MAKFNIKLLTKAHYKTGHSYYFVDPSYTFNKKKGQNSGAALNFRFITTVPTGVSKKKIKYSERFKIDAVNYYVAHNMTIVAAAKKFEQSAPTFRNWVKKYSDFKLSFKKYPESYKMEAVSYFLKHGVEGAEAEKCEVSRSTFRSWVKKYGHLYSIGNGADEGYITFLTGLNSQSPDLSLLEKYHLINKYFKIPITYYRLSQLLKILEYLK
jgi:transposase-like protein